MHFNSSVLWAGAERQQILTVGKWLRRRCTPPGLAPIHQTAYFADYVMKCLFGLTFPHCLSQGKGEDALKPAPLIGRFGTSLKIGVVGLPNVGWVVRLPRCRADAAAETCARPHVCSTINMNVREGEGSGGRRENKRSPSTSTQL